MKQLAADRREAKLQAMAGVTMQELAALPADAFSTEIAQEKPVPSSSNERNDVKSTSTIKAAGNATVVFSGDCKMPQRRHKSRSTELDTTQIELVPLNGVLPVKCQEHRTMPAMAALGQNQHSPWVRKFDADTQRYYYANRTTRQTVWQRPAEGWRSKSRSSPAWVRKQDPNTQRFYYANIHTREAVWHEPSEGWHQPA